MGAGRGWPLGRVPVLAVLVEERSWGADVVQRRHKSAEDLWRDRSHFTGMAWHGILQPMRAHEMARVTLSNTAVDTLGEPEALWPVMHE